MNDGEDFIWYAYPYELDADCEGLRFHGGAKVPFADVVDDEEWDDD